MNALRGMQYLVALSLVVQTLELLQVRRTAADDGIWRLSDLKRDWSFLPSLPRALLDYTLAYRPFVALLVLRLLAALTTVVWPSPVLYGFLLISTLLISIRWRGSFNGGSDFMTLVLLSALLMASVFPARPSVADGCLWYVAIITCNSYFIAGLAKVRRKSWRDGTALRGFVRQAVYQPPPSLLLLQPTLAVLASLSVLLLECGFPAALVGPRVCLAVIATMFSFHLGNAWVFGLNRFVFAWVAAYPALYHCSTRLAG